MIVNGNIEITVRLINSLENNLIVKKDITGKQLKKAIFAICQELDEQHMSIHYQGTKITNNMKLSQLVVVVGGKIKVIQSKIDLAQVPSLIAEAHQEDLFTQEKGVAKLSCGHWMGKDSMTGHIKSLISQKKYQIRCPHNEDNKVCNILLQFFQCKKIGVFTKTEIKQFQQGLSINWLKQFSQQCPQCKSSIWKNGLQTNRVVCSSCKYGDFCFLCLKKWKGNRKDHCGNEQCQAAKLLITNAEWNKIFKLKDINDGNITKQYKTPQFRACIHCKIPIEHKQGCKHMLCPKCNHYFCYVCLGEKSGNQWPCGAFNQYCGKVAQTQQLI